MSDSLIDAIHYFRIPVTDLSESVTWYSECLNLKLKFNKEDFAVYELHSGPLLVLVEADKESRGHFFKNDQPEFSIGFTTSNIQEFYDYLVSQGVKVESIEEDAGHHFFHFYDPSGNKLQIHN
ncbi:VOC family protein [Halobacillus litoralis]|uniref:VOC family protein n=1 Tax=Halobacillus litoralis TaxID=45668 RepID=UPI001CFD8F92|nr:VOC family protein [Halobacillus litoralis]